MKLLFHRSMELFAHGSRLDLRKLNEKEFRRTNLQWFDENCFRIHLQDEGLGGREVSKTVGGEYQSWKYVISEMEDRSL